MFRNNKIDEYGNMVFAAINDLFKACDQNSMYKSDVLLCFQNGFRSWDGAPSIGVGEEGLNSFQCFNSAFGSGLPDTTDDVNYFQNLNSLHFNGMSNFEKTLKNETTRYIDMWENMYLLRLLIQLSHLVNGEHYDWDLNVYESIKKRGNVKSNVIEHDILNKFANIPTFESILKVAYNRDVRNAIAHSQWVLCQYGMNIRTPKNYDNPYSLIVTFEEWEKIFLYTYFLFHGIWKGLNDLSDNCTNYVTQTKCGVPIFIPNNDQTVWFECKTYSYTYLNKPGCIWRFTKPEWAID